MKNELKDDYDELYYRRRIIVLSLFSFIGAMTVGTLLGELLSWIIFSLILGISV